MAKIMPSISEEFIELRKPSFAPYVFVYTTRKTPTSVGMAAAVGGEMKIIELSSNTTVSDLPAVQQIVRAHFRQEEGHCPLFGDITGFLFVHTPTEGIALDVQGNSIGRKTGTFWPQSIHLQD